MKRIAFLYAFLSALFGVGSLRAQFQRVRPVNNYCPVCGTWAEPFRPTVAEWEQLAPCGPSPSDGNSTLAICRTWTKETLPKSREVTCKFCRVVYSQDAETK